MENQGLLEGTVDAITKRNLEIAAAAGDPVAAAKLEAIRKAEEQRAIAAQGGGGAPGQGGPGMMSSFIEMLKRASEAPAMYGKRKELNRYDYETRAALEDIMNQRAALEEEQRFNPNANTPYQMMEVSPMKRAMGGLARYSKGRC